MNTKTIFLASIVILFVLTPITYAGNVTIPNNFTSGTPAVAADVNANFNAVAVEINDNDSRISLINSQIPSVPVYDFNNYIGNTVNSHTYDYYQEGYACDREVRNYTRTSITGGTRLITTVDRTPSGGGARCHYRVAEHLQTAQDLKLVSRSLRDTVNTATELTFATINFPVTKLTNVMRVGVPWGDASGTQWTPAGSPTERGHIVEIHTLLAVEDVPASQVPAGPFTGCLKIHTSRRVQNNHFGRQTVMSWYCPNVGLVRQIKNFNNGGSYRIKLLSYN